MRRLTEVDRLLHTRIQHALSAIKDCLWHRPYSDSWAGQPTNYASFPGRRERIISFPDIQIGTEAHPPIQWIWGWGRLSLGVKGTGLLTIHLHLVLKLRTQLTLPMPLWHRGESLSFQNSYKKRHFNIISIWNQIFFHSNDTNQLIHKFRFGFICFMFRISIRCIYFFKRPTNTLGCMNAIILLHGDHRYVSAIHVVTLRAVRTRIHIQW